MKAYRLQQVDKKNEMHQQAWLNHVVTLTKESGKKQVPVYKTFKDFFDYEKELQEATGTKRKNILSPKQKHMAKVAYLANSGKLA